MATQNDVNSILAALKPIWADKVQDAVSLPDRATGFIKKSPAKPVNAKGFRQPIEISPNTAVGATLEAGNFLAGKGHGTVEMLINTVSHHISGLATGTFFRNVSTKEAATSLAKRMMKDFKVLRMNDDINFCLGDGLYSRGVVSSISVASGITSVTFTSSSGAPGAFYIEQGRSYYVHHPTTFALHGNSVAFPALDKTSSTVYRFTGDMSAGTTAAANDLIVPIATGDSTPQSALNRAVRGLSYFTATTGDYFGIDRDTIDLLRGLRVNGNSNLISHQVLEQGNSAHMYRNNNDQDDTRSHIDFIPPCQRELYLLNSYGLRRLDTEDYKNYDGAPGFKGDGGRQTVVDKFILDSGWWRLEPTGLQRFVLQEFDVWDLDGLQQRPVQANSSILDVAQWHVFGEMQYAHIMPWSCIEFYSLSTSGARTKSTS